ncbi:hypothetical protein GCM10010353_47750 [Streptomyces chryseus]|uniref:hypothetical protein n=1 Tax=Streptomyces chryseus TaxID=68186 RepID=UPI00142EA027|nr:hypothetical protein [Streptomyces chryseus]GGX26976.1 hypothetical protein GCM10010353_47750 [Streptomyces chryseus]
MAKLATVVHVTDDKGTNHVFSPADEVPAWAARRITNPKAWAELPLVDEAPELAPVPVKKAAPKRAPARRKAAADVSVHGE